MVLQEKFVMKNNDFAIILFYYFIEKLKKLL